MGLSAFSYLLKKKENYLLKKNEFILHLKTNMKENLLTILVIHEIVYRVIIPF